MSHPSRLILTIGGIALCMVLMLFLLAVHQGVADGSVEYIRQNQTDLWVLQHNSWNILRGTSILSTGHGNLLRLIPSVESASPILLLLPGIRKGTQTATVFLAGYEPQAGVGGPPKLVEGRSVQRDDEIVLDRAFAERVRVKVGESVQLQDDTLRVVGLSSSTNALVIQYAFVSLSRAQAIVGLSSIVSCYLVKIKKGFSVTETVDQIKEELPGVEVYDHETFLQNNIREMESGFLPLLYTIAAIGAIVLTAIMSLLLTINILERRKDLAVMKALGSTAQFLRNLVIQQALTICAAGSAAALLVFFPMCSVIEMISPAMSPQSSIAQAAAVVLASGAISLLSSFISVIRLRRIYPLEVFT